VIHVREYGDTGPMVIILHGGPAAVGEAAPIARGLSDSFRVLEPWQRGSGHIPLSVSAHIADLNEVIDSRCAGEWIALVGESWGAMLALAYAAAYPDRAGAIVLIGCGTFDKVSRLQMQERVNARIGDDLRRRLKQIERSIPDPQERLKRRYELTGTLYDYDPIETERIDGELPPLDMRAHTETWSDMLRLQEESVYPAAFAAIRSPVLMLHGVYDPHPGRMIYSSLRSHLPQVEYHEWEHCGHRPWIEREVRAEFFDLMRRWLLQRSGQDS
jgi:pimeloyl-ACP methyl ester carboxylesterase